VTAFIIDGYKTLYRNSGDNTVLILMQMSQQLAALANGSHDASPFPPLNQIQFQPLASSTRAVTLWFLSLGFGLACALSATLVEQWARDYLNAVQRRPAPHKRARISSFLFNGLEQFGMAKIAGAIPTLLHISLFFFLAGLVEYLLPLNPCVAYLNFGILIICTALYTVATILPLIFANCPYQTPLSEYIWRGLELFRTQYNIDRSGPTSMERAREIVAMKASPARDQRDCESLRWTLESLTEEDEFQPFVEGIPGFLRSKSEIGSNGVVVMCMLLKNPAVGLGNRIKMLLKTCDEPHTISPNPRRLRAMACLNAIWSLMVYSFNVDPSFGADWHMWCHGDLVDLVKKFRTDKDSAISNSAFNTTTTLVHRLLWNYTMIPVVTEQDLDAYIYARDLTIAQQIYAQLHCDLSHACAEGLELLDAADWLVRVEVKEENPDWKHELPLALDNAFMELDAYLASRRPALPTRATRSSLAAARAIAMPTIPTIPPPNKTRELLRLLARLRRVLNEVRCELLIGYVSRLLEKTSLTERARDTLCLTMGGLPTEPPSPATQARLVDCLRLIIEHDRSLNTQGTMTPAINVLINVVQYLVEEDEFAERAVGILDTYLETNPHSELAREALVDLQRPISS
jgi:hypothetical protein